ncbi:MAG: polyprenyl diphosphate synthase [Bryobacteraceae bacterium]
MFHTAIIMDGNGRWAARRGLPRLAGHREGAESLRRILKAAPGLGITDLTVYAFSADNWKRPPVEVDGLMRLLGVFLEQETAALVDAGVRFTAIGRRDRLPLGLRQALLGTETATCHARNLHLRVALDYSSRDTILAAAAAGPRTREDLDRLMPAPPVDLLVRTADEQRLSDFLLWECAYAEFWFTPRMWPEFGVEDLAEAVGAFRSRNRRFGGLAAASTHNAA